MLVHRERVESPDGVIVIEYHRHAYTQTVKDGSFLSCSWQHGNGAKCNAMVYYGYIGEAFAVFAYREKVADGD